MTILIPMIVQRIGALIHFKNKLVLILEMLCSKGLSNQLSLIENLSEIMKDHSKRKFKIALNQHLPKRLKLHWLKTSNYSKESWTLNLWKQIRNYRRFKRKKKT
jgi:predicted flavoprotein YhiN